jgi:hypothetical protein
MSSRTLGTAFVCLIVLFWCYQARALPSTRTLGTIATGQLHDAIIGAVC